MNDHSKRENNFGVLRLLFAVLVIVSHSPEMIDHNRSREILTQVFGTMSFGEMGVDGFFLISGYLITKSFVQRESVIAYLKKRFLRIVPGYLASFWICVLLIAPFVGAGHLSLDVIRHQFSLALFMLPPDVPGAFQGLPYEALNGSMWTIAYEFRCYFVTIFLGLIGIYKPGYRLVALCLICLLVLLNIAHIFDKAQIMGSRFLGDPIFIIRFGSIYGVGMLFYLFRDKIRFTGLGAAVSAVLLFALMFNKLLAETAFSILGAYLIFWFAFEARVLQLSRTANRTDISYGLYLYAWPVQNLVIWANKSVNPWLLCCITIAGAGVIAYVSWMLIEKPFLRLAHKRLSPSVAQKNS